MGASRQDNRACRPDWRRAARGIVPATSHRKEAVLRVRTFLVTSLLLTAVAGSGAATPSRSIGAVATTEPLLGVVRTSAVGAATLVRLDASTLIAKAGRRVALGRNTGAWAFSPDR